MKKSLVTLLLFAAAHIAVLAAEAIQTGAAAPHIPSPVWLDGKLHRIADARNKKITVLIIWNIDRGVSSAVQLMGQVARQLDRNKVELFGIAGAKADLLKKIPGIAQLPFPVCADHNRAVMRLYARNFDPRPLAVVIDKNGIVNWRGSLRQLPAVVNQLLNGKFDLKEQIRVEKFSAAVAAAVKARDFEKALSIVRAEWERYPKNIELLSMQLLLLERHLKRPDDAFKLIAAAHQKKTGNPGVYELEFKLIRNTGKLQLFDGFCDRLLAAHGDSPELLVKFADLFFRLPVKDIRLDLIAKIFQHGWKNGKFANNRTKGRYALDYANLLHSMSRTDLALQMARNAEKILTGKEKSGAADVVAYYLKIMLQAPKLKL